MQNFFFCFAVVFFRVGLLRIFYFCVSQFSRSRLLPPGFIPGIFIQKQNAIIHFYKADSQLRHQLSIRVVLSGHTIKTDRCGCVGGMSHIPTLCCFDPTPFPGIGFARTNDAFAMMFVCRTIRIRKCLFHPSSAQPVNIEGVFPLCSVVSRNVPSMRDRQYKTANQTM